MNFFAILQKIIIIFLVLTLLGVLWVALFSPEKFNYDWSTASRASANIAPSPQEHSGAVVQLYAARAYGWRGLLADHTWVATKGKGDKKYKVYQMIGWLKYRGQSPLYIKEDTPDRMWFGHQPRLIKGIYGAAAERAIAKVNQAMEIYPYRDSYVIWPGPNSNSFTAYLIQMVPELSSSMPPLAVGKDFIVGGKILAPAPSRTGYQLSFLGIAGVLLAREEGLEINVLGLVFGVNFKKASIILPAVGYIPIVFWS